MDNFRFIKWKVYIDTKELVREIFKIYNTLPESIKRNIGDQLVRSAISISLNIAEGSGKSSDKELNRFLDIAVGSTYETLANIDLLRDNKYIDGNKFIFIYQKIENICKQLGGFKKKLK